jgi:hypothetical protein
MKVQLSGKEYVSNLEGLGFNPMLPHFFLINYLCLMGWWAHMAVGGGGQVHEENLNLKLNMSLNLGKI